MLASAAASPDRSIIFLKRPKAPLRYRVDQSDHGHEERYQQGSLGSASGVF